MGANNKKLAVGIIMMGLAVFYVVWYPLHVHYDNPSMILIGPYAAAILVLVAGLILVTRYRKGV